MDETQFLEWVDKHQRINEAKFLQLVDLYGVTIGKICRLYRSTIEGQDILYHQIVFQLWKSAPAFIEKEKFSSWVYRVALTTSITSYSDKRSNLLNKSKNSDNLNIQQVSDDPKEDLIITLRKFPDDDKAIIILYMEGVSYPEIAEITGLNETIIGVKLNRIKKRIQQLIKSTEQYPLKSIWRNIYTAPKSHIEVKFMLSDRSHPNIKSIGKRLIIEGIAFILFVFTYYNFFGSNLKPIFLQVILAIVIPFIFINNIFIYILTKTLAKGTDIKKSLEDNLAKLKSHVAASIISRLIVVFCLLLFGKLVFTNEVLMYITFSLVLFFFSLQLLFVLKHYSKRIGQMKNTIDHLKRQKEFSKNGIILDP